MASCRAQNRPAFALPNFGNDKVREFLRDLEWRCLVSNRTLTPGRRRSVRLRPAAALNSGLRALQIIQSALGMDAFRKGEEVVIFQYGTRLDVIKKAIAVHQTLPDVGVGEEASVLGVFREFDSLLDVILSEPGVVAGFGAVSDPFLDAGVFDHAAQ